MKKLLILSAVALLSACAASPKSIAPVMTTGALACNLGEMNLRLHKLYKAQQSARTGDIIGIALIGIPVGGHGQPEAIAKLKGEIIRCGGTV